MDEPTISGYFIDVESPAESARLIEQDRLFTRIVGGVWPELDQGQIAQLHDILDVACGPGGWTLDIVTSYHQQGKQVVGIDISEAMIAYATSQAKALEVDHLASFQVMDATEPFDFPDESFDLVNIRFIVGFLPREKHDLFFRECTRLLRPGGIFRVTESELGYSNSPALEQLASWLRLAVKAAGNGTDAPGLSVGMINLLPSLLQKSGYTNIKSRKVVADYSAGTAHHAKFVEDWKVGYWLAQDFFIQLGLTSKEEFERLHERMLVEMLDDGFKGFYDLVTFIATKPIESGL